MTYDAIPAGALPVGLIGTSPLGSRLFFPFGRYAGLAGDGVRYEDAERFLDGRHER